MLKTTTTTKFVAGVIAILPSVLPDALSLAQEWTWITLAVAVIGFIIVSSSRYFNDEDKIEKKLEVQFTCAILAITCLGLGVYRSISGLTATATILPGTAVNLAEFAGTQQRLSEMTAQVSAEVARIGKATDRTEAKVDSLAGKLQKNLAVQQVKKEHIYLEVSVFSAKAQYPLESSVHLDLAKVDEPSKWINMTQGELPALVSLYFGATAYSPRDLDFRAVLADKDGNKIADTSGVLMRVDDFSFEQASTSIEQDLLVNDGMFDIKNFIICLSAIDLDSGENFTTSNFVEFDDIREIKVSYDFFGEPLNVLPSRAYTKERPLSHAGIIEEEFCAKLASI